jgi:phage gp29-like protein
MNLLTRLATLAAAAVGRPAPAVPTRATPSISPRGEPANLAATATAGTIQSAIRSAEAGDTTSLFRLYRDTLLSDDHVQSCLNTRKLAVLAQPLSVMALRRNHPDDLAAAAAVNRAIADCENWTDALGALLDSALWPVAVVQKVYRPADEPLDGEPRLTYTLRQLVPVNPLQFCWRWARSGAAPVDYERFEPLLRLWPLDPQGAVLYDQTAATPLDPELHLVHRGHLLTGFPDYWGGPMRAVLGWWLLRSLGRDWFGRFMERYGNPFIKGRTNINDEQAVTFMQEALALTSKLSGIIIGPDDEAELVQAMVQGGAEGHALWLRTCNDAISRAITGIAASENPAGLNAGQSHKSENVREDVRMFDQLKLAGLLERGLFAQFLRVNGLPGRIKLSFGGLSDEDAKTFADMLDTLNRAGFEPADEALPTMNDRLGLPIRRKAAPPLPPTDAPPTDAPSTDAPSPVPLSASGIRHPASGIVPSPSSDPSALVARAHAKAVGTAMADAFGPAVKLIEESTSPADAEARLAAFFADWRPRQFVRALEAPLQICAAAGAVEGKS